MCLANKYSRFIVIINHYHIVHDCTSQLNESLCVMKINLLSRACMCY